MRFSLKLLFFGMAIVVSAMSVAQAPQRVCFATVLEGDTIPLFNLREVSVMESHQFLTEREKRQNKKLIRNVKKMMPYALIGKQRLDQLEREMAQMNKRDRKKAIAAAEDKLRADFEEELKKCTFSQGKVLIKLIDRETGRTSYNLVGELRGTFRASFYQVFARIFGFNLKTHYDPEHNKEDELMERVILAIKCGQV